MAVRLQMKLGVVAEAERLQASPDTSVVVEPTIGSIARSKGSLYLLVTGRGNQRQREATRLVAESIQGEYYYDESAGIVVCLEKAIRAANKRLTHGRDHLGVGHGSETDGPIGVAVAVVRGSELYVVTVGPAEAYLIRGARLLTLPDPHRDRGLPTTDLQPDVWRGEIAVGDSLVLVSPNVTKRIGSDELKDALVTLHPQSAVEHLHHRFVAEGGAGSDGAMAIEATEVAATQKQRKLVPVWPDEPLAGAPERSPIPLADTVSDGVAAVQASAHGARVAAGNALVRGAQRLLDLMPRRGTRYRRVTTLSARRETQRRAAIALIAFVGLAAGLGVGVWALARSPETKIDAVAAGQQALDIARDHLDKVFGEGKDLVTADRPQALELLTDAYKQLAAAARTGVPAATIDPLESQVVQGLDRLFGVVPIADSVVFSFGAVTTDLRALVQGPDGAPYVLDRVTRTVYRIDIQAKKATVVVRAGAVTPSGLKVGEPRLLAVGGPDLLVLDSKDQLWRWRPADAKGRGTLTLVRVKEASSWGTDIKAMGTYLRSVNEGLYNLYVVDASSRQILRYSPAADGSGFPAASSGYLATAQDVSDIASMYIDGDVYVTERGNVKRFSGGQLGGWSPGDPHDQLLRPTNNDTLVASPSDRGAGLLYLYDQANARVVALDKATGAYREQYRLAGGSPDLHDARGMFVVSVPNAAPVLYWIDAGRLMLAPLTAVPDTAGASSSPSPSPTQTPRASSPARRSPTPTPSR